MNNVLYDWLSFTSQIDSPQSIIELLGMTSCTWQELKGANGYRDRLYYDSVNIHYNGREGMGVWCELTGQGCRAFETYGHGDYDLLFGSILTDDYNITRLDVAYDDFDKLLDIKTLIRDTFSDRYISKCLGGEVIQSFGQKQGSTITFGSRSSNTMIRIYDKKVERNREDIEHWVRCEIQLRDENARNFLKLSGDIRYRYFSVLNNYLRFIKKTNDSNKWRSPLMPYWKKFIETYDKNSVFVKPGVDYNILHLKDFVIRQTGGALYTLIKLKGLDYVVDELHKRTTPLNPKYKNLLDKYKNNPLVQAELRGE